MSAVISIKTPARICFFGDHQDYLELPVIAGAINRFVTLTAVPNNRSVIRIEMPDIGKTEEIDLKVATQTVSKNNYFQSGMAVLKKEGITPHQGYDVTLSSTIPINAGLSSSSAVVVSWIRFLTEAYGGGRTFDDFSIGKWAYEAEVAYFKQPGGIMDHYSIALRGLLFIDTKNKTYRHLNTYLGCLIVAESGVPKKTLRILETARLGAQKAIACVQKQEETFTIQNATVHDYEKYLPLIPKDLHSFWYAAIHNYQLTKNTKAELLKQNPQLSLVGEWMQAHQQILQNQIQNTPLSMTKMIESVHQLGAWGAKIVGSGGGGCIVAMTAPANKEAVIKTFLNAGAVKAYEVQLIS